MRKLLRGSIRVRLMFWYGLLSALVLAAFSSAVYVLLRDTLSENLDESLQTRAGLVRDLITFDGRGYPQLNIATDRSYPRLRESFQRVFDAGGALVFDDSARFGAMPVDGTALSEAAAGRSSSSTYGHGGNAVRVLTVPIISGGRSVGALQVGQSGADLNHTIDRLFAILLIALVSALVLVGLGGLWLSTHALRPIDRITRMARDITSHDLSRRLNLALADDEVGRLARTFDNMIARLDEAFARQRSFTADASHELRTPLTAIRGQIDVALQRPRGAAAYRQTLSAISDQVDRMTRLVSALLMLARADEGAIALRREAVQVDELITSVAIQMRPAAHQRGLSMEVASAEQLTIMGDEDLLLQLVLNLVDNAVKYTETGGVTLGWQQVPGGVRLFVADTGGGIPQSERGQIFERFHRGSYGRGREQSGAGLGLAICRRIVEAHRGVIDIQTSESGTTCSVELPVDRCLKPHGSQ